MAILTAILVSVSFGLWSTGPGERPDPAAAKKKSKTLCVYRVYHETYYLCSDDPPAQAQKACEAQAKAKYKEDIECSCTQDPEEVADRCDPPPPPPPKNKDEEEPPPPPKDEPEE